jgi:hypothetical protein
MTVATSAIGAGTKLGPGFTLEHDLRRSYDWVHLNRNGFAAAHQAIESIEPRRHVVPPTRTASTLRHS